MPLLYPFFLQGEAGETEPGMVGNAVFFGKLPFFTVAVSASSEAGTTNNGAFWAGLPFLVSTVDEG